MSCENSIFGKLERHCGQGVGGFPNAGFSRLRGLSDICPIFWDFSILYILDRQPPHSDPHHPPNLINRFSLLPEADLLNSWVGFWAVSLRACSMKTGNACKILSVFGRGGMGSEIDGEEAQDKNEQ